MAYLLYAGRVSSNGTREQPVDTGPHDPFAVDEDAALTTLPIRSRVTRDRAASGPSRCRFKA
jgi:hypothetical protein